LLLLQIFEVIARTPIDLARLMGTDFYSYSAGRILTQGVIRPYAFDPGNPKDFPSLGFYRLAGIGGLDNQQCKTLLKKLWRIAKGKQGAMHEHGILNSGGITDEQHLVRRKGTINGSERWCVHSTYAHIHKMAVMRPIYCNPGDASAEPVIKSEFLSVL
jgi:hypothetical protein